MLATGAGALGINLAVSGAGAARLTASGGPATVAGAGASLVSTSSAEGVVIASAPLAGNTSDVVIVTGTAAGGSAGDVSLSGGEGAVRGGSIVLRPGSGGRESGGIELHGASSSSSLPHVAVGGAAASVAGASTLGLRGVSHFGLFTGSAGSSVGSTPPGSPVMLSAAIGLYQVVVSSADESVLVVVLGGDMVDGQVVWLLNSPASSHAAVLQAGDGVLACDDSVSIARGRMAAFMTWNCVAGGGGCSLIPVA
jgi:hypothetical protein